MRSFRSVAVAACSLIASATLVPASAWGGTAQALAGPRHYAVGFEALPPGLGPGDELRGAEVERVDRVLDFARVTARNPEEFLARARTDSRVRYVVADPLRKLIEHTPNDPSFPSQYGPQHVRAPEVWDTTLGDLDAAVCVVDTGVRYTHEEIAGARWLGGIDYVNGDDDPWDDDNHGSHVAGIAAGGIDNALGIAGVANVGIYGVKVLNQFGQGTWTNVASGIRWCADNGGPRVVINMSLGGGPAPEVQDAVQYAYAQGALIVASAGNDGPCSNCIDYPAKYPEVMAITCTTSNQSPCDFSSDGPESELAAPGDDILSLDNVSDTAYREASGTSMSAPYVSGVAALVWSELTNLSNAELRQRLRDNALDLGTTGWDPGYGYGLVDAKGTLDNVPLPPPPQPRVFFENFDDGTADGWTLGGLWHVDSACSPPAPSPPNYLGYHRPTACDYSTGARTTGSASFNVDLVGHSTANLEFMYRFVKENYQPIPRDIGRVDVFANGSWMTLKQWTSRTPDQTDWTETSIDLTRYAGKVIKVRFLFDSVDGVANDFDGWRIDNVEVTVPPGGNQPPDANAGPDQTATDGDGSGSESVTLDGTGSSDSDGTIVSYEWREAGNLIASGPTPTVDFPVGNHIVTLTVMDDDSETDTDTVTITVNSVGSGPLIVENFDDGTADGWTLGGLWHVDSACSPPAPSPPNYLGYHRPTACDYSTGARTTGSASFNVDLVGHSTANLEFMYRFVKENYQPIPRDIGRVDVFANGSWMTLKQWTSRTPDQTDWTETSIDLTRYAGKVIKVRFLFDSVDGVANDFDGWRIDDVEVSAP